MSARLTIRLPDNLWEAMDKVVVWGEFGTRSEFVRLAIESQIKTAIENGIIQTCPICGTKFHKKLNGE